MSAGNELFPTSGADLLQAARNGDPAAWAEIIARHSGTVRSVIAEFRLQESDVADVVQGTWLRLLVYAGTVRDPERLGGWLATTARREALALIRRGRAEVVSEAAGDGLVAADPTPEETVLAAETRAAVRAATDELTERRRALVDALFFQPRPSYEEVSRRTGLPVGSIGPTRGRALRELRRRLEPVHVCTDECPAARSA